MYQLKTCFAALLLVANTSAWSLFSGIEEIKSYENAPSKFEYLNDDLADQLNQVVLSADHKKALAKLVELQSKPTCSRHAASRLMVSCASLSGIRDETSQGKQDVELEDVRNAYAISLAICQFDQAGVDTPEACYGFRSSSTGRPSRGGLAKKARSEKEQLKSCLNSLYLDGSAWTTFTENHQTARVICEASRVHDERDKMIEIYKRRADVDSTRTNHHFEELNNFVKSFDMARSKMTADLDQLNKESGSFFDLLQDRFAQFTDGLSVKLSSQFSAASVAADRLVQTVVRGEQAVAAVQQSTLNVTREMSLGAHDGRETVMALQVVLQEVVNVVRDLQIQVAEIKQNNIAIDERSRGTLDYVQSITTQLQTVNALQEENIERALYMAQIQDDAAESARRLSSWLGYLGIPTWREVVLSDFRVLGMRWQVLFGSLGTTVIGGNHGLKSTVKTNSLFLVAGFTASGVITVAENTFRALVHTPDFAEHPAVYGLQMSTTSIRTTPVISTPTPTPLPDKTYGSETNSRHPHYEMI